MHVSLFITCVCDTFYPNVGKDTVEVLEDLGCEVDFPEQQTCCGQPAYNSGYVSDAKQGMKHMMDAFAQSNYVVGPSGSCVAMLREYAHIFKDDPEWKCKATELAEKTYELSEFIVDVLGVEDVAAVFPGTATYHSSCHMTRLLGIKEAPFTLLQHVKGLTMAPLPDAEDCCGFGGTFAVKNAAISEQMVQEKCAHVHETSADYLIGADMGCLMNIDGQLSRSDSPVEVLHIASVLNQRTT
ncbi:(Fe-S)-binding protein [Thalassobacillus sp. CUG 92003]|uniref:(Fe-S)-binding protein n=1 Tax=Thalassobacillus sp. CUG 92003 TaxID=2736641 RepID=UPI0015E79428|nr:(Fe-S)-binding protein [Thalassobacillus sp. CUG 92003]